MYILDIAYFELYKCPAVGSKNYISLPNNFLDNSCSVRRISFPLFVNSPPPTHHTHHPCHSYGHD